MRIYQFPFRVFTLCALLILSNGVVSDERLLDANVDANVEYNDNIFLTDLPHDSVSGLIVTPSLSGIIKEENWNAALIAKLRFNKYSDHNLNSNDQYFDLTGQYQAERNIYTLNINHDLDSNLNSTSSDFGIVGRRVNRKRQGVTPKYTRLVTERLAMIFSYTYTDVEFLEAENTGFIPYISQSGNFILEYDLTERNKINLNLSAVDYNSRDDLVSYQLFISQVGVEHEYSSTLSVDFAAGISRRNSTNRQTSTFNFFGNLVLQPVVIDASDRGFVLNAGLLKKYENSSLSGRLSRDNTTNSLGGLDQIDGLTLRFNAKESSYWSYILSARYEDVTSISTASATTDRDTVFLESIVIYSLTKNWKANASYRYIQRKFKSDVSNERAPRSNRIYVGLSYNFPSLSTF